MNTVKHSFAPEFLNALPSNVRKVVNQKSSNVRKNRTSKYDLLKEYFDKMPVGGYLKIGGTPEVNDFFGFWATKVKEQEIEEALQLELNKKNVVNFFTLSLKPKNALGKAEGDSPYKNCYDLLIVDEETEEGVITTLWIHKKSEPVSVDDNTDDTAPVLIDEENDTLAELD